MTVSHWSTRTCRKELTRRFERIDVSRIQTWQWNFLKSDSEDESKTSDVNWLNSQAAEFYEEGIKKLVPRYDKCRNVEGDYVENLIKVCINRIHQK